MGRAADGNREPEVYLAYASGDAAEMAFVAEVLRNNGFAPVLGPLVDDAEGDPHAVSTLLREAGCVIVGWSSYSVGSTRICNQARAARELGKLVAVKFDHAEHPFADIEPIDLSQADHGAERATMEAELVGAVAAKMPASTMPAAVGAERDAPPSLAERMARLGAGPLILAAGAALAVVVVLWPRPEDPAVSRSRTGLGAAASGQAATGTDTAAWVNVPQGDIAALKAFLVEHPDSRFAGEAHKAVGRLEAQAWYDAGRIDDAIRRQDVLQAYLLTFETGEHRDEALEAAEDAARRIALAQRLLQTLGYLISDMDGKAGPETQAAVKAFEYSTRLPVTGKIDGRLLVALEAAVPGHAAAAARRAVEDMVFTAGGTAFVNQRHP